MSQPDLSDLSLAQIKLICRFNPRVKNMLSRELVDNYSDFVAQLYLDIDQSIIKIEDGRHLQQDSGEDLLTVQIVNMLNLIGYNASHDKEKGGHVDLVVEKDEFTWLGEAKIFGGTNTYLWEGILQLTTRYATGRPNANCGGLVVYIFDEDAKSIMDNWATYISNKEDLEDYKGSKCPKNPLAFFSQFKNKVSGLEYKVRHIPVLLHFNPQDKSGRRRNKTK